MIKTQIVSAGGGASRFQLNASGSYYLEEQFRGGELCLVCGVYIGGQSWNWVWQEYLLCQKCGNDTSIPEIVLAGTRRRLTEFYARKAFLLDEHL